MFRFLEDYFNMLVYELLFNSTHPLKIFNKFQKSWYDAQSWCSARGMDLVTVNDENENAVLKEKLKQIVAGNNY
jgi:hypothetical protein